jgi:hypothetical protein
MTIKDLETALKIPEAWKRSDAINAFRKSKFGVEAMPVLVKALDDEFPSVVLLAIECIGQLGPEALTGESSDMSSPRGLVAKLFSLGNHCIWCYSTSLRSLVKLGYKNKFLFEYIQENIGLESPADSELIHSLTALKEIGSPEALNSRLPDLNKTYTKKVHAILKMSGFSEQIKLPKSAMLNWHPFHTLMVKAGQLWVGDPHLPNADDGCIVKVPSGKYVVECDGLPSRCQAVSKLRVRLESAKRAKRGKKLGETGTDSATIGVCEIAAFEAAYKSKDGAEQVQEAIDSLTESFGVLTVPNFPEAIMPFVPTGSDGNGPVFALISDTKCVGVELLFMDEANA